MIELRSQINFRISSECNISLAITHILDDHVPTEMATNAGSLDQAVVQAYLTGYAAANTEGDAG